MDAFAFQGEMVLQAFCDAHVPEVSYLLYAVSELFPDQHAGPTCQQQIERN